MIRGRLRRLAPRLAATLGGIAAASVLAPDVVLGHQLNATYTSRLPLAIYLAFENGDQAGIVLSLVLVAVSVLVLALVGSRVFVARERVSAAAT